MTELTIHTGNKAAIEARRRNAMASRLLLLRLQRYHSYMDLGPARHPLPSTIVGNPLINAAAERWKGWKPSRTESPVGLATRLPSVGAIVEVVCRYFKVQQKDLLGHRRLAKFVRPRQIAMYLAIEMTAKSSNAIGAMLNRDHATVLHGYRLIQKMIDADPALAIQVLTIRKQVEVWISIFPEATEPLLESAAPKREPDEWNETDCRILIDMKERGCLEGEIAQRLGRSKQACSAKFFRLKEAAHAAP